jgi:glutathionylspermidine synthase
MSLVERANAVKELFEQVDRLWESYVAEVRRSLREWERLRPLLVERLSVLKSVIASNLEEMQELSLKLELGLVDEAKAKRRLEELNAETPRLVRELEELWVLTERIVRDSILHMRRAGMPIDVSEEDIAGKEKEVEECFKASIISKEAFEKLKGILAEQLAALKPPSPD